MRREEDERFITSFGNWGLPIERHNVKSAQQDNAPSENVSFRDLPQTRQRTGNLAQTKTAQTSPVVSEAEKRRRQNQQRMREQMIAAMFQSLDPAKSVSLSDVLLGKTAEQGKVDPYGAVFRNVDPTLQARQPQPLPTPKPQEKYSDVQNLPQPGPMSGPAPAAEPEPAFRTRAWQARSEQEERAAAEHEMQGPPVAEPGYTVGPNMALNFEKLKELEAIENPTWAQRDAKAKLRNAINEASLQADWDRAQQEKPATTPSYETDQERLLELTNQGRELTPREVQEMSDIQYRNWLRTTPEGQAAARYAHIRPSIETDQERVMELLTKEAAEGLTDWERREMEQAQYRIMSYTPEGRQEAAQLQQERELAALEEQATAELDYLERYLETAEPWEAKEFRFVTRDDIDTLRDAIKLMPYEQLKAIDNRGGWIEYAKAAPGAYNDVPESELPYLNTKYEGENALATFLANTIDPGDFEEQIDEKTVFRDGTVKTVRELSDENHPIANVAGTIVGTVVQNKILQLLGLAAARYIANPLINKLVNYSTQTVLGEVLPHATYDMIEGKQGEEILRNAGENYLSGMAESGYDEFIDKAGTIVAANVADTPIGKRMVKAGVNMAGDTASTAAEYYTTPEQDRMSSDEIFARLIGSAANAIVNGTTAEDIDSEGKIWRRNTDDYYRMMRQQIAGNSLGRW